MTYELGSRDDLSPHDFGPGRKQNLSEASAGLPGFLWSDEPLLQNARLGDYPDAGCEKAASNAGRHDLAQSIGRKRPVRYRSPAFTQFGGWFACLWEQRLGGIVGHSPEQPFAMHFPGRPRERTLRADGQCLGQENAFEVNVRSVAVYVLSARRVGEAGQYRHALTDRDHRVRIEAVQERKDLLAQLMERLGPTDPALSSPMAGYGGPISGTHPT